MERFDFDKAVKELLAGKRISGKMEYSPHFVAGMSLCSDGSISEIIS